MKGMKKEKDGLVQRQQRQDQIVTMKDQLIGNLRNEVNSYRHMVQLLGGSTKNMPTPNMPNSTSQNDSQGTSKHRDDRPPRIVPGSNHRRRDSHTFKTPVNFNRPPPRLRTNSGPVN